ncbi:alanine racemase [Luteolibacter algae]|uniref:Alanine racemase n=1 Tax=Luteolibacter algae TaxID=454151 RepID=A0ABW5DB07_9BACT
MPISPPRAWVEINLNNLGKNLETARTSSGCGIMAVVKAGAYGHGLERISKFLEQTGIDFLGVANIGEARRIRDAGVKTPIYLLGATWDEEREEIVARNITPCISTISEADAFNGIAAKYGKVLNVHLAIDTGMGRGGFLPSRIVEQIAELRAMRHLNIEGIASHFSSSDEDEDFTNCQIASFRQVIDDLGGEKQFSWRHLSNSAGILAYPNAGCNLARPGLMLYGVSPITSFQQKLKTVMSLKSRVTMVKTVPKGHSISYGRSYITPRPMKVATVGIGYGDGYPRQVSGKGAEVFIDGKRYPILGRVTMDQLMVALPDDSSIRSGAEVELFGTNIPAMEVAEHAGTIVWEVFTGITPRVERIYLP